MRIAIGSDHTGLELKRYLVEHLRRGGHEVVDFGTQSEESVDYPDIAAPLTAAVVAGEHQLGILICSNGVGISISANKVRGARCALVADTWSARRAREHTDCNVLALGSFVLGTRLAAEIVDAFVGSEFEGGRHVRRLAKLAAIESEAAASEETLQQPSGTR